jgi:hypothetical protein
MCYVTALSFFQSLPSQQRAQYIDCAPTEACVLEWHAKGVPLQILHLILENHIITPLQFALLKRVAWFWSLRLNTRLNVE